MGRDFKLYVTVMVAGAFLPVLAHPQAQSPVAVQKVGNVTSMSARGNLEPTRQLKCIDLSEAKNSFTPADLHTGIKQCLAEGQYDRAVPLFALAGIYAKFDSQRVADISAKDGGQALIAQTFATVTPEQKQRFRQALSAFTSDPDKYRSLCVAVGKVGPPDYFPAYMVMHGMNVFLNGPTDSRALIANFDAKATWADLQVQYLHCTK
jgi:hypothetical protein